jgi:hypothetical protein
MRGPCSECWHWTEGEKHSRERNGVCSRHAPKAFMVSRMNPITQRPESGATSMFPPTNAEIECGDFEKKPI